MNYIEVLDAPETTTDRTLIRFLLRDDLSLMLERVLIQRRATRRHVFRTVAKWSPLLAREPNIMKRIEPSEYAIAQAISQVRMMVRYEGA